MFLGSIAWRGVGPLVEWFSDTYHISGRVAAWGDALQVFRDFFWVGSGIATFSEVMLIYQRSNHEVHLNAAHNDYLQLLADGGLLVTVPAAIALVSFVVTARRIVIAVRQSTSTYWLCAGITIALASIAIQEVGDFSLQMPANAFFFATLMSMLIAARESRQADNTILTHQ
jgi:O-antigen ligase